MHKLNLVYLPPAAEELLLLEIAVLDSGGKHIEYEKRKNAQWRKVNTLNVEKMHSALQWRKTFTTATSATVSTAEMASFKLQFWIPG